MVPAVRIITPPCQNLESWLTHAYLIINSLCVGHGAGAIYALASFFAFAAPRARFLLFFVVPMPAWACIGAIACFDVYNAFTRRVRRYLPLFFWLP
jgi:membrane associated rhomboid family serine protease